jgi:hypothetical protein
LKDSIPHAKEKDEIDVVISSQNKAKKEAMVGMPKIKLEIGML